MHSYKHTRRRGKINPGETRWTGSLDTFGATDYLFLTPGPAHIILSPVADSDLCLFSSFCPDSMGEEYHIRGAPRIPPFVVVVSVLHLSLFTNVDQVNLD